MDLRHLSKKEIVEKRRELFHLLNGDAFYPSKNWPRDTIPIFWKKPIGDLDTFKLMFFYLLEMAAHLILYQNGFSLPNTGLNQPNETSANDRLTSSRATLTPKVTYGSIMISTAMIGYT